MKLTIIVNGAIIKEYRNGKLYKKRSTNNNGQSKKKVRGSLLHIRQDPQWDCQSGRACERFQWDHKSEKSRERFYRFEWQAHLK